MIDHLVDVLGRAASVRDKVDVRRAFSPAEEVRGPAVLGDDCAALPDGRGGFLLFAAEGMQDEFIADDPWFAGYSALMVNVSDVCAMGGRPLAVVDVLWTPDHALAEPVWDGLRAASTAYGVPIVGGHTTLAPRCAAPRLAVSILGRADRLVTSFAARPGDELLMAVDLNGSYRGDKPFWNSSSGARAGRLRSLMELWPELGATGWCNAAKDISNGGVVGTLVMMLECSRVGATLDLDRLPAPEGVGLERWLLSFPSFGYLLSVAPAHRDEVVRMFEDRDVACRPVGLVDGGPELRLRARGEQRVFWSAAARSAGHY